MPDFLDLNLPLSSSFDVEHKRRILRECSDPDVLRGIAEALVQETAHLSNVVTQLMGQVADLEVELAQAGAFPPPSEKHLRWAQELLADLPRS